MRINGICAALAAFSVVMVAPTITFADASCVDLITSTTFAGQVCSEVVDGDFCVTYTISRPWEMDAYHLWIGQDIADMPSTKKGNPKLAGFPTRRPVSVARRPLSDTTRSASPRRTSDSPAGTCATRLIVM